MNGRFFSRIMSCPQRRRNPDLWRPADRNQGENMAEKALVVQGGRLIDGTGRPPIDNSVIVIQVGKFQAVGRSGEVVIPADAQGIDGKGKTVLPGFTDGP